MNGFARLNIDHQAGLLSILDFTVDLRLIITQRLSGFFRLLLGAKAEVAQCLGITLAQIANIPFDVGLELRIGRLDPDIEASLGKRGRTHGHQEHAAE